MGVEETREPPTSRLTALGAAASDADAVYDSSSVCLLGQEGGGDMLLQPGIGSAF